MERFFIGISFANEGKLFNGKNTTNTIKKIVLFFMLIILKMFTV